MKPQLLNGHNNYIIGYFETANQIRWCTEFSFHPKIWKSENHKPARVFEKEHIALEVAEAMLLNGVPAFVAEVYETISLPVNDFGKGEEKNEKDL